MASAAEKVAQATYARGVGLTPRLFEELVLHPRTPPIKALAADYVHTIGRHVHSVSPSPNVMAQYWCPIVVYDEQNVRHVLHVDPLAVRQFRNMIIDELRGTREKRQRILKRIRRIQSELPQMRSSDIIARLRHEIDDALGRVSEPLLVAPPPRVMEDGSAGPTGTLYTFIEASLHMCQLDLVKSSLGFELPKIIHKGGTENFNLAALHEGLGFKEASALSSTPLGAEKIKSPEVSAWLDGLRPTKSAKRSAGLHLAKALRWAMTHDGLGGSDGAILLVVCSRPVDLEDCLKLIKSSSMPINIVGVYGMNPEDPEPALQQLVDAAAPGSSLRLWFGPDYWRRFAESRKRVLCKAEEREQLHPSPAVTDGGNDEVVCSSILEMRLMEKVMRECYDEEAQCEEELECASHVLQRSLVDREDVGQVLRAKAQTKSSMVSPMGTLGPAGLAVTVT